MIDLLYHQEGPPPTDGDDEWDEMTLLEEEEHYHPHITLWEIGERAYDPFAQESTLD